MKNSILLGCVILACTLSLPVYAQEYPASASMSVYDQSPWENSGVLNLFVNAWNDNHRNYPTKEELKNIGLTMDLEFVRSHTRYRNIVKDESRDIVSEINHDRNLWCNLPGGYGKSIGGYPSTQFDQDVFSLWNYTSIFGSWNYGFLLAPGAWVDAAHKNGTRIYGGIRFFDSNTSSEDESSYVNLISTPASSGGDYTYEYSRAFVNAAAFFGNDGYNYNCEKSGHRTSDWISFHAEVRKIANELKIDGFGIGMYTNNTTLSAINVAYAYGSSATGVIYDCMLDYTGNRMNYNGVVSSLNVARNQGLDIDHLYQGQLLAGLSSDYWREMNTADRKAMNICIWGEHDQSRFFQFRVGEGPTNVQENYQLLLEKAFSGANRNPLNRPVISNSWGDFQVESPGLAYVQLNQSPGFASMFPERTAIDGKLPFQTYFSLGNGENYFYKGKITHGSWYNMSQQDIVPTYRWLVTAKGDMKTAASDIDVRFTHEDAYVGGSSIRLSGATSTGNDVILYRTNLTVSADNPKVTLALKTFQAMDPKLSVLLKVKDGAWVEVPAKALTTSGWELQELDVTGVNEGDVIENIGLRVNESSEGYKVLVGQLKVSDDRVIQHAGIDKNSLQVEVKEEKPTTMSVKIGYEPDCNGYDTSIADYGMVYNDELNIDHFEILVKDEENGKAREVARTSQWAAYVGNLPVKKDQEKIYVGVRSVSVDLKCMSPVVWVEVDHYQGDLPVQAEDDPYGRTWMSSIGNGTLDNCAHYIYAQSVTTTGALKNLAYNATSNPSAKQTGSTWSPIDEAYPQYYFAQNDTLVIEQGKAITIAFRGYESNTTECLHYAFINVYLDLDGNYSFLDKGEVLGKFGSSNAGTTQITNPGVTMGVTIPSDARRGESRLRIVASDAWTPHPGPTGGTVKGFSIDFPVLIVGDNEGREPAKTYKDYRDDGEADEPEHIEEGVTADDITTGVDTILESDGSRASVVFDGDVAIFANTDEAWIYNLDGKCAKYVANAKAPASIAELPAGIYVVKMLNGHVVRSAKVVKK